MSLASCLCLAACGEGWTVQPYNQAPYDGRTAGTGVAYVRANMLPKKEMKVDPDPVIKRVETKKAPDPVKAHNENLNELPSAEPLLEKKIRK